MTETLFVVFPRFVRNLFLDLFFDIRSFKIDHPSRARIVTAVALVPAFCAVAAFAVAPLAPDAATLPVEQVELPLPSVAIADQVQSLDLAHAVYRRAAVIERSDTLGALMIRLGIDDRAALNFIRSDPAARALAQLRAGRSVFAEVDERGTLVSLHYPEGQSNNGDALEAGSSDSLVISRDEHGFSCHQVHEANLRQIEMRSGEITSSLYGSTDAAGVPDQVANQIAEIFSGEIDFYRDLHRGDRFRVVYETYGHDGMVAHTGRVLAVEFVAAGKVHQAVWYQPHGEPGSYYGFDGRSMRRAFLKAPLQFTRISSGFGGREHPILNIWKWHTGVDYAAPTGTPIRATADGMVKFVGQQTGYGNSIELKHQGVYSTLYGHMSAFAHGIKAGQPVTQGQVIGYVGMTGWATGPHLHYEFRIAGVAHDPLHVAMPDSVPIAHDQLATFHSQIAPVDAAISRLRSIDAALPATASSAAPRHA
jgi:murein DD-endopeptidase MepM/ murein hydrolase activator NlpD